MEGAGLTFIIQKPLRRRNTELIFLLTFSVVIMARDQRSQYKSHCVVEMPNSSFHLISVWFERRGISGRYSKKSYVLEMPNYSFYLLSVWCRRRGISDHGLESMRSRNAEFNFLLTISMVWEERNQRTFSMVWEERDQRS